MGVLTSGTKVLCLTNDGKNREGYFKVQNKKQFVVIGNISYTLGAFKEINR